MARLQTAAHFHPPIGEHLAHFNALGTDRVVGVQAIGDRRAIRLWQHRFGRNRQAATHGNPHGGPQKHPRAQSRRGLQFHLDRGQAGLGVDRGVNFAHPTVNHLPGGIHDRLHRLPRLNTPELGFGNFQMQFQLAHRCNLEERRIGRYIAHGGFPLHNHPRRGSQNSRVFELLHDLAHPAARLQKAGFRLGNVFSAVTGG